MNLKHGKSKSPIYGIWRAMINRCDDPRNPAFANYGGRGISVCPDWRSFDRFYADMGDRPRGKSLDRIDNDAGYSRDNCRWADRSEQSRNRRNIRLITVGDRSQSMAAWAAETGIKLSTISARIASGWPADRACTEPLVTARKGIARGQRLFGAERGVVWTDPKDSAAYDDHRRAA